MIHGALELLQKWDTLIYTRYRSNYKKKKINTNIQIYGKWILLIKLIVWVNWFIFPTEPTQEERTKKKIRINLNTEKASSLFTLFTSFSHKTNFAH